MTDAAAQADGAPRLEHEGQRRVATRPLERGAPGHRHGVDPDARRQRSTLKLEHRADTVIARLSGGERRRLMVHALDVRQPVMLMDEPTSGLTRSRRWSWCRSKQLDQPAKATIMTIHTPIPALFGLFDKLLLLHRGELIFVALSRRRPPSSPRSTSRRRRCGTRRTSTSR